MNEGSSTVICMATARAASFAILATLAGCGTSDGVHSADASDSGAEVIDGSAYDAPADNESDGDAPAADVVAEDSAPPTCPPGDYYVRLSGDVDVELRHFSFYHAVHGSDNDLPAYYRVHNLGVTENIYASEAHDEAVSSRALFLLMSSRVLNYEEDFAKVKYFAEADNLTYTVTRDDGVGGVVEGSFDAVTSLSQYGAPTTTGHPIHGTFRVCHLADEYRMD